MPTKILLHVLKSSFFYLFFQVKNVKIRPLKKTLQMVDTQIGYNGFFILESLISKSIIIPRCIFECKEKTIERVNFMTLVAS